MGEEENVIIGGADGETVIFGGKTNEKNPVRRIKNWTENVKFRYVRKRKQKELAANPHSLE